jgi:hypothetical protein
MVHIKPAIRQTWAPHAVPGWYLGTAIHHYRCHRIWIPSTRSERISDTVTWFPTKVQMPIASHDEHILAILLDLLTAVNSPSTGFEFNHDHRTVLKQLTECFINTPCAPTTPSVPLTPQTPLTITVPTVTDLLIPPISVTDTMDALPRVNDPAVHPATLPRVNTPPDTPAQPRRSHRRITPIQRYPPTTSSCVANITQAYAKYECHAHMVQDPTTGMQLSYLKLIRGPNAQQWTHAAALEIGRLAQGYGTVVPGTNTMFFLPSTALPQGRIPTYLRIVADETPHKTDPVRVRFTVGGDKIFLSTQNQHPYS